MLGYCPKITRTGTNSTKAINTAHLHNLDAITYLSTRTLDKLSLISITRSTIDIRRLVKLYGSHTPSSMTHTTNHRNHTEVIYCNVYSGFWFNCLVLRSNRKLSYITFILLCLCSSWLLALNTHRTNSMSMSRQAYVQPCLNIKSPIKNTRKLCTNFSHKALQCMSKT